MYRACTEFDFSGLGSIALNARWSAVLVSSFSYLFSTQACFMLRKQITVRWANWVTSFVFTREGLITIIKDN
ncbi:hypothetical protein LMG29542_08232 [Paraburkholderia humisilvae]|uniref:Uncharacterized protein n=1 Tax=Paraburkholderia humisilvae TaxID=627669 RepID=A0A6J5F7I5_9BURK|nr:hypothetical protein LMG29542_08232 [Paraburkholderia humisilvae]